MKEHETFIKFQIKLIDVVNSNFNIDKPISNSKIVIKDFDISFENV